MRMFSRLFPVGCVKNFVGHALIRIIESVCVLLVRVFDVQMCELVIVCR